jgi:Ca2+-binding EF-hand superfamily protein
MVLLLTELYKNIGQKMSADVRIRAVEHVRVALQVYAEEDGGMRFPAFLRMLTSKPWNALLSPEMREGLPWLLKRVQTQLDPAGEAGPTGGAALLGAARRFFEEGDTDGSGAMDQFEMRALLTKLLKHGGKAPSGEVLAELATETAKAMAAFGNAEVNQGETLTFKQFLMALGRPFFVKRLEPKVRDEVLLFATKLKVEEHEHTGEAASEEAAPHFDTRTLDRQVLCSAKRLFDLADDGWKGWLNSQDLRGLTAEGYMADPQGDGNAPGSAAIETDVRQAFASFDPEQTGRLDFVHFMRLLNSAPWKHLLPTEFQADLRFALLTYMAQTQGAGPSPSAKVLEAARVLFAGEDADANGYVDREELAHLVHKLAGVLQSGWAPAEEEALLDGAMARYGHEGQLDFDNFLGMIVAAPWRAMLPKNARNELLMEGRKLRSESPMKDPLTSPITLTPTPTPTLTLTLTPTNRKSTTKNI